MDDLKGTDLIYDWNVKGDTPHYPEHVKVVDETLRDGLQSPSVTHPSIQDKVYLLYLMRCLQIDAADLGLCGAGERFKKDVTVLAKEIVNQKMGIVPQSAARTLEADIAPIVDASQEAGIAIEASVTFAVKHGLPVMFVTEDTTRAQPEALKQIYTCAIRSGAHRICAADTVGHATPEGVRSLIRFLRKAVDDVSPEVGIDWHGHKDRGLDIANTLAAIEAGANRVHACALGVGERSGNTPMEILLVNLNLLGMAERDLAGLPEYCQVVSQACGVPIPFNYPIVGADSFRT